VEQRRLDDAVIVRRHGDWAEALPRLTVVFRPLHPADPGPMAFDRRRSEDCAVAELDRLIFDWAKQSGRELLDFAPGLAVVRGTADVGRPGHWTLAGFVEEEDGAGLALEKDRIPARKARFLGGDFRFRPRFAIETSLPDADVLGALIFAAEPGRQQTARLGFDDSRGVA